MPDKEHRIQIRRATIGLKWRWLDGLNLSAFSLQAIVLLAMLLPTNQQAMPLQRASHDN